MQTVHKLIKNRWSPVAFDPRPVENEKILLLFEAAKWAPSSGNKQPWRFIFATIDTPDYDMLFGLLKDGNKVWAKTAPLLVLSIAQTISTKKNHPNRYAFYDTGMAVGNMLVQATYMGLYVHQMGGYDKERARNVLNIPWRYEPAAMMAIGYKGDPATLPKKVAAREKKERTRKELGSFLFAGKFS